MSTSFSQFGRRIQFSSNDKILGSLEASPGFYWIETGILKVSLNISQKLQCIGVVTSDEIIGNGLWNKESSYEMVALTNGVAFFMSHDSIEKETTLNPTLQKKIYAGLYSTIYKRELQIFTLEKKTARARIAGTLLNVCQSFKSAARYPIITLTKSTLAELSGTVLETLSRNITAFENEGLIQREGKGLVIKDVQTLTSYFQAD